MPPAMRMPGIEMPKKFMIRLPASRKPAISTNEYVHARRIWRWRSSMDRCAPAVMTSGTALSGLTIGRIASTAPAA